MTTLDPLTPDGLRTVPHIWAVSPEMDDLEKLIAPYAAAWTADRVALKNVREGWGRYFRCSEAHIEALEKAARAYLNWHRRQKLEPESPADFLNEELKEDELGDALAAALAKEKTDHVY